MPLLSKLNSVSRNIVTVEDPVEYRLPGINQVASDNEHGLGFANALKYIMRQDPDVIMVGEIRDHETAATAVQAALTGHLLISTLHANDAVGAIARLDDLGVDNFKIGGALLGSIAQRLLRQICTECKEAVEPNESLLKTLCKDGNVPSDAVFYRGRGCKKCVGTGYSGRLADLRNHDRNARDGRRHRKRPARPPSSGKLRFPKAWSNSPPPAWSKFSPAAPRWKKCSTSYPAKLSVNRCPSSAAFEMSTDTTDNGPLATDQHIVRRARKQSLANARRCRRQRDAKPRTATAESGWRAKMPGRNGHGQGQAQRPRPRVHLAESLDAHVERRFASQGTQHAGRGEGLEKHRDMLHAIRRRFESGESFSSGLAHFGDTFDTVMINQIKVGEHSGTLGETLTTIARHCEDGHRLQSEIVRKLAYPVHARRDGIRGDHVPVDVCYSRFQKDLRRRPRDFAVHHQVLDRRWSVCERLRLDHPGLLVVTVVVIRQLRKRADMAYKMDAAILRAPVFGHWLRDMAVLQLMEVLGQPDGSRLQPGRSTWRSRPGRRQSGHSPRRSRSAKRHPAAVRNSAANWNATAKRFRRSSANW